MSTHSNAAPEESPETFYSGKWTFEETEYVKGLIEEFEAGNCPDARNGSTLRWYIAKKLGCMEKRVTKKVGWLVHYGMGCCQQQLKLLYFLILLQYENTGYKGRQTYQHNKVAMTPEESQNAWTSWRRWRRGSRRVAHIFCC
jgi:hypothetical protein